MLTGAATTADDRDQDEIENLMRQCVEELPGELRGVMQARLEGKGYREIGDERGYGRTKAGKLVHRAMQQLHRRLQQHGWGLDDI